ncbi:hypothetical protein [Serratia liquefaciens]|uniref:hypothetical protein n=1 Tax=Serratia liquefaciens TaxID=614 RepID=UPI0038B2AA37
MARRYRQPGSGGGQRAVEYPDRPQPVSAAGAGGSRRSGESGTGAGGKLAGQRRSQNPDYQTASAGDLRLRQPADRR